MLHHNNAHCHTAISVNSFLASKNIPVAPQSFYLVDLNICDFFLFLRLKNYLDGRRFGALDNIQTVVTDQLKAIPVFRVPTLRSEGIVSNAVWLPKTVILKGTMLNCNVIEIQQMQTINLISLFRHHVHVTFYTNMIRSIAKTLLLSIN